MKKEKKHSTFQIVSSILIAIFVIAIIVQIGIIIKLKIDTQKLKEKNEQFSADCTNSSYIFYDL